MNESNRFPKTLSPRENFECLLNNELPEWIPLEGEYEDMVFSPWLSFGWCNGDECKDPFGVEYVHYDKTKGPMPKPGVHMIDDLARWKELIVPYPDLDAMDWETLAAQETAHCDREHKIIDYGIAGTSSGVLFNSIVNYMGHSAALEAMVTDEDAWHELMEYMTDWWVKLIRIVQKYYHPDCFTVYEDVATKTGLFMSPQMYRDMIKPYHKRLFDAIHEVDGVYANLHCCGLVDDIIPDWVEMGVRTWNPAQVQNDFDMIKRDYGKDLILVGGWDSQGEVGQSGASEELIRSTVRKCIDRGAKGGGYVFGTSGMIDERWFQDNRTNWIHDEWESYGYHYYNK